MNTLEKTAKRMRHPVSETQRRWAWAAERRGELPKGKAHKWSKRVEGEDLPEKISSLIIGRLDMRQSLQEIRNEAFADELKKIAQEGQAATQKLQRVSKLIPKVREKAAGPGDGKKRVARKFLSALESKRSQLVTA